MGIPVLGEKLNLSAKKKGAAVLINDSGMSGLAASNHLHNFDKKDMYCSKKRNALVFELPRIEALGQMHIWNYNATRDLSSGMKDIDVSYSLDGNTYNKLGDFTLETAYSFENEYYGGIAATNCAGGRQPIDFKGIAAKFIRIKPKSNYGGEYYGLSQIRLFRHKIRPAVGSTLPVDAFCHNDPNATPMLAFCGLGMSDRTSVKATACTDPAYMWHSSANFAHAKAADAHIVLNMDGTYPIREIAIWNYNDPAKLNDGVKEMEVYYTVKAPCDIVNKIEERENGEHKKNIVTQQKFVFTKGEWIKLGDFTVAKGTGKDKMTVSTVIPFGDVQAQHIRIQPKSNYGGKGFGLSEVRVFSGKGWAVEPSRDWTGLLSTSGDFRYTGTAATRDGGWIGADGIFSYNLDGPQTQGSNNEDSNNIFIFQDTVVGKFNNYTGWTKEYGYKASHNGWVNCSYLYLKGNKPDPRKALFVLQGANSEHNPYGNITNQHYWLCDFTKVRGDLYITGIFYFGWDKPEGPNGHDLVRIPLGKDGFPDLTQVPELVYEHVPNYVRKDGVHLHFEALLENTKEAGMPNPDGYIYIYGRKDGSRLVISRVKKDEYGQFDKYEYYNGEKWVVGDVMAVNNEKAVIGNYHVGNEASISPVSGGMFKGKFLNVYTAGNIDGQLAFTVSDAITGPFENPTNAYWAVERYKIPLEDYDGRALAQWNYNAKAHHNISAEGELLISYHMGLQMCDNLTVALEHHHPWFVTMFEVK